MAISRAELRPWACSAMDFLSSGASNVAFAWWDAYCPPRSQASEHSNGPSICRSSERGRKATDNKSLRLYHSRPSPRRPGCRFQSVYKIWNDCFQCTRIIHRARFWPQAPRRMGFWHQLVRVSDKQLTLHRPGNSKDRRFWGDHIRRGHWLGHSPGIFLPLILRGTGWPPEEPPQQGSRTEAEFQRGSWTQMVRPEGPRNFFQW